MINCTPGFRLFAQWRYNQIQSFDPATVQNAQLQWLLKQGEGTRFGKDHNFASIKTVEDYQQAVPLRSYDDFWKQYWGSLFPRIENQTWPGLYQRFTWSSGTTTGKRKYLPYTDALSKSYNKAGTDLLVYHAMNNPQSKLFGGKSFMMGGTTHLTEESPGILIGEVSGFSAEKMPFWTKPFFFPPKDITDIPDWMTRADTIAEAIRHEDIRLIGGMPSWLLIFLERFKNEFGADDTGLLHKLFPNLEMFVHGGVSFEPYKKQYQRLLEGSSAEFREIYPASEAFMAANDRGYGEGMRLHLDHNLFFEFVPVEELSSPKPTRHWVKTIEPGVNYAIVLTTCAGSWSYILGDTVKFVDVKTPRIVVTGRTSYSLSAFGEHVINDELEKGIATASESINAEIVDFAVCAKVSALPGTLGHHRYYVECKQPVRDQQSAEKFRATLDQKIKDLNDDYLDHRGAGCGVYEPEIIMLESGTFSEWMKSRGKLGDQHKVARVLSKDLVEHIDAFIAERRAIVMQVSSRYE